MRFFLVLVLSFLVGCGQKPLNMVEGTVTLDGKAVENATVTFSPLLPQGIGANGITDASGKFTLFSAEATARAGAAEGEYEVSVSKASATAAAQPMMGSTDEAPTRTPVMPKAEIPAEYSDPKTSKLRARVVAGKNENVKLELTKNPKK